MMMTFAALATQLASLTLPIGVAATDRDGQICLALPMPALTAGASVTLIQPDRPQSALAVTIDHLVPSCAALAHTTVPGPYYLAQRTTRTGTDPSGVWVAVAGNVETGTLASGDVAIGLSATHSHVQVRSCASGEGVHLTAWTGTPLTSQRLWHEYYYLGFDVEPSCDATEVNGLESVAADDRAAVEAATTAFHQALRTNDLERFMSYVAEDVFFMPPGEPPVRGRDAVRKWMEGFLAQYRTSSLTLADREVIVGSGWAVELGTFEWQLQPAAGGPAVVDRGNYMQVWKQLGEKWQFAREVYNSSVPPAPGAAR